MMNLWNMGYGIWSMEYRAYVKKGIRKLLTLELILRHKCIIHNTLFLLGFHIRNYIGDLFLLGS